MTHLKLISEILQNIIYENVIRNCVTFDAGKQWRPGPAFRQVRLWWTDELAKESLLCVYITAHINTFSMIRHW